MVWLTTVFVFTLSRIAGDPRDLYLGQQGVYVTEEQWEEWGRQMGLDRPVVVQYFVWLSKAVRGEFGESLIEKVEAREVIMRRMGATLHLAAVSFGLAVLLGVPLGIVAATRRGSLIDMAARIFALLGQALPVFFIGIVLILIFAVHLDWLPSSQRQGANSVILPAFALGWAASASLLRLVRSSMLEVLDSEYIKLARAKGVSRRWVVWKHAFRNALIPPLTQAALLWASFITGTVVIESVFAWPGLGRLAITSVFQNDFPMMTALVVFFTIAYVGSNLLVDVAYGLLDPRVRY